MLSELLTIGIVSETAQAGGGSATATDFLHADNFKIKAVPEMIPRNYSHMDLDSLTDKVGKVWVDGSFRIPVRGSGTRGSAFTPFGAILKSCGLVETVTGGASVIYSVTSAAVSGFTTLGKTAAIETYKGDTTNAIIRKLTGVVGTKLHVIFAGGGIVMIEYGFRGLYVAWTTGAKPGTITPNATKEPKWESNALSVHTTSLVSPSLEFDLNPKVAPIVDGGAAYGIAGFDVVGRDIRGKFKYRTVSTATFDPMAKILAETEGVLAVTVGGTAGNINAFSFTKCQLTDVDDDDTEGVMLNTASWKGNRSTGDDSFTLTQT